MLIDFYEYQALSSFIVLYKILNLSIQRTNNIAKPKTTGKEKSFGNI